MNSIGGTNLGTHVVRLCSHGPHVIASVRVFTISYMDPKMAFLGGQMGPPFLA